MAVFQKVSVENYSAKRTLMQELRARLVADAPEETLQACELLLEIEEDLTRLQFMLCERQSLLRRVAELRDLRANRTAAA